MRQARCRGRGCRLKAVLVFVAAAAPSTVCAQRDADKAFSEAIKALVQLDARDRKDMAEELERVRQRLAVASDRVATMRQWTQYNFDLERQGRIQRPQAVSKYLQGLQHRKRTTEYALLEFRDQSRGAIKSGRALNYFLDECGPAALEMDYCSSVSRYQSRQGDANELEREVLSGMTANYPLDDKVIRHIRYRRGLTGSKLTGRINQKPLDLEHLNSALRKNEFRDQLDLVASLRDRALAELDKGQPVSSETAGKLVGSLQELLNDIRSAKKKKAKFGFNAMRPYLQAERQMFAVFEGASRLIEAHESADVTVEEFKSGTVRDLLAYMQRNNLHFDQADDNGEEAYNELYTQLSKFYLDLRSLQEAVQQTEAEYSGLAQRERQIENAKLFRSVAGVHSDLWGKTFNGIQSAIQSGD